MFSLVHAASALVFIPMLILNTAVRGYWARKALQRPVAADKSFAWDKINIALMNVTLYLLPLIALFTPLLNAFDRPENPVLLALSVPFLAGGVYFVWASHRDLGENWSVTLELKDGHGLVTDGIYRRIRHPMYLSIWLWVIGQALCIPNAIAGGGVLVAWAMTYFVRIDREEKMMAETFGPQYIEYAGRTKRLIPHIY